MQVRTGRIQLEGNVIGSKRLAASSSCCSIRILNWSQEHGGSTSSSPFGKISLAVLLGSFSAFFLKSCKE